MKLDEALPVLSRIQGCTFASLDAVTFPTAGLRKVTTGKRVLLFTNQGGSGYESMVKRRLREEGKNPDDFVLSDLPWGARMPGTPLFVHRGEYYLQTVELSRGETAYYIGQKEVNPNDVLPSRTGNNQGLENAVVVSTYNIKHITRLAIFGMEITDDYPERARLSLKLGVKSND